MSEKSTGENPCRNIKIEGGLDSLTRPNRVLDFQDPHMGRMLDKIKPKIDLATVKVGINFQFAGDRHRVRKVVDVDGEYVLIKTLSVPDSGSDLTFYIVHYSWLRPNQSVIYPNPNQNG